MQALGHNVIISPDVNITNRGVVVSKGYYVTGLELGDNVIYREDDESSVCFEWEGEDYVSIDEDSVVVRLSSN